MVSQLFFQWLKLSAASHGPSLKWNLHPQRGRLFPPPSVALKQQYNHSLPQKRLPGEQFYNLQGQWRLIWTSWTTWRQPWSGLEMERWQGLKGKGRRKLMWRRSQSLAQYLRTFLCLINKAHILSLCWALISSQVKRNNVKVL